jgi:hypothetical protein
MKPNQNWKSADDASGSIHRNEYLLNDVPTPIKDWEQVVNSYIAE